MKGVKVVAIAVAVLLLALATYFLLESSDGITGNIVLETQATGINGSTLNIELAKGFNLISIPCDMGFTHAYNVLATILGKYNSIYTFNQSSSDPWTSFDPALPNFVNQDLDRMYNTQGYWIDMKKADTLTIFTCDISTRNINLVTGWNLVGWPSNTSLPIATALQSINGSYTFVYAYNSSDTDDPAKIYSATGENVSDLFYIHPFQGYWIHMLTNDILEVTS